MISKDEFKKRLNDSLKSVTPGDLQAINRKISEHLKFGVENYDQLEPDAQKAVDNGLSVTTNYLGQLADALPESKDKRKLKRIHAIVSGDHAKIESVINALEAPPELKDDNSKDFRNKFIKGLQNIIDLMFDVQQKSLKGPASFGQLSLVCMCIDELLAAFHLAQHHYVNQAFTHVRTVFEHLDKIELFRSKPEWANIWCGDNEEKNRKELSPVGVRKKLGKHKYDPMYSMFSQMGPHGTFRAVQSRTVTKAKLSTKGNPELKLWYGGCPLEHNIVWVNAFALYALYLVVLQIMKSFATSLNREECDDIVKNMFEDSRSYIKTYFIKWARENKLDVDAFEKYLDSRKIEDF